MASQIPNQSIEGAVSPGQAGLRLDAWLAARSDIPSRSYAAKLLDQNLVCVNNKPAKASHKLKAGDVVSFVIPQIKPSVFSAEDIPLDVIYEDQDLIVLNKARGLVVHPGAGHATGTLTQALLHHCKDLSSIGGVERPGIVHRLDKGTSGLMVVAKNDQAHIHLGKQFKDHTIIKKYLALIQGKISPLTQRIETNIARHEKNRKKYQVHLTRGKEALSSYKVLSQNKFASLVEVQILTGRTHQIRVHMSHKGHPLWGDALYGARTVISAWPQELRGLAATVKDPLLHSAFLEFEHPRTHKRLSFRVDPPKEFESARKILLEE